MSEVKIFIDTADIGEIRKARQMGVLDGVTTNPTLVSHVKRPYREVLNEIAKEVEGPVSAEVISVDTDGMLEEARSLARIGENILSRFPIRYSRISLSILLSISA
jgi:transaldolase